MISSYGFTAYTEIEVVVQRIGNSLNLSETEKLNCIAILHENWIFNLKTLLHVPIDLLLVMDLQPPSFKQELCKVCMYLSKPDSQFFTLDLENARVLTLSDTQKVHITASLKTLVQLDGGFNVFFKKFSQGLAEEGTVPVFCPGNNARASSCFLGMITWLVENIHKSHIGNDLDVIGASHMVYGLGPRHYEVFVDVFCATLESFFTQLATERAERPEKDARPISQRESLDRLRMEHPTSSPSTPTARERERERERDSARDREGAISSGACSLHSSTGSIASSAGVELPAMEDVQAIASAWHQCLTQVTGLMTHAANFMKQGVKFNARVSRGSSQVRYAVLLFNSLQLYKDEKYFSLSGNYPLQCASVTYPEKEKSRPFYVDIRCFNPVYELLLVLDTEADYVMLQHEFAWRLKALKRARNLERPSHVAAPVLMDPLPLTPYGVDSPSPPAQDSPSTNANTAYTAATASSSTLPSSVFAGAAQHVPTHPPVPHSPLRPFVSSAGHTAGLSSSAVTPRIMTTQPPTPRASNTNSLASSLERLPASSTNRSPSRSPSTGFPIVTTNATNTNANAPEKEKEKEHQAGREAASRRISLPHLTAQPLGAKSLLHPPSASTARPSSQRAVSDRPLLTSSISSGSLSSSQLNNAQWIEEASDNKLIPPLTFDPANKAIVIRTWKQILNLPQGVNLLVRLFYQLFFEVNPTALRLFRGVSIDTQGRALMVMINFIISNIDDTDALDIKLKHLGGRHMIYGVLPSDYTTFVTQLGRSVCTVLAGKPEEKDKSPEGMQAVFAAWENVFTIIADVMYLRGNEIQREGYSCEIERKIKSANQGYWEMNTCTMVFDKLLFYSSKDKDATSLRPLTIPLSTIALVEVKTKDGMRLVNISLKNRMKHYWFRCPQASPFIQELSWRLEANMWPVTDDPMANSPRSHEGKADALIMDKDTVRSPATASRKKKSKEARDGK